MRLPVSFYSYPVQHSGERHLNLQQHQLSPEVAAVVAKHIDDECNRHGASENCNVEGDQAGDDAVYHVEDYQETHRRGTLEVEWDEDESARSEHDHCLSDHAELVLAPSTALR